MSMTRREFEDKVAAVDSELVRLANLVDPNSEFPETYSAIRDLTDVAQFARAADDALREAVNALEVALEHYDENHHMARPSVLCDALNEVRAARLAGKEE